MAIWQLCANLLIPNCLRSNLSYSPLAALELYVKVDNSEFTILGQFDRTAAGGQTEKNIPGYKVYDFKLPDALLNRDNICIRLRPVRLPAGVSSFMPLRLANISIKYNK